jgi:hypothetical protein
LADEGDAVVFAQPVVDVRECDFAGAEFAALEAEVLGAGVEAVDLGVGPVGDQGYVGEVVGGGKFRPLLDCGLGGEVAVIGDMEMAAAVVVGQGEFGCSVAKRCPSALLVGVAGAADVFEHDQSCAQAPEEHQ